MDEQPTRSGSAADRAWPALPIAAVGVTVLVVLVALLTAPSRSAGDQVRDAVDDLALALTQSRGVDACSRLTPAARAVVVARSTPLDCARAVQTFGLGIDAEALRRSTIGTITLNGGLASIAAADIHTPDGKPFPDALRLIQTGGRWRVDALTPSAS